MVGKPTPLARERTLLGDLTVALGFPYTYPALSLEIFLGSERYSTNIFTTTTRRKLLMVRVNTSAWPRGQQSTKAGSQWLES